MAKSNIVYDVESRPGIWRTLIFSLQQLLAILAATIAVPAIINGNAGLVGAQAMSPAAALFGAGVGTLVYLVFTKFKSPVFLGSSFAFIGSMTAAFAGAATVATGYLGLLIGAVLAGLVYVILALVIKKFGTNWINKLMPAVVIGPTVAIIGLSLAGNAIGDFRSGAFADTNVWIAMLCGLTTLIVTVVCSVYGNKFIKTIPFVIGIACGYVLAALFTLIGTLASVDALKVIDFSKFQNIEWIPSFSFINAFTSVTGSTLDVTNFGQYFGTIALAYVPVALVVFAEHIADHKNLSTVIDRDLLKEPGLHRTLLGDGVGSMAGAFFGGCPNTTYGESVGCVAISGNASIITIITTACMCIVLAFVGPFTTLLATIPPCVMGGVCITLYGFIAVSGLKMLQKVDLNDKTNLFTASVILIAGIGGLSLTFGSGDSVVTITSVATSLILGIVINKIASIKRKEKKSEEVIDEPKE